MDQPAINLSVKTQKRDSLWCGQCPEGSSPRRLYLGTVSRLYSSSNQISSKQIPKLSTRFFLETIR